MSFFSDAIVAGLQNGGYVLTEFDDNSVSTVIPSSEGINLSVNFSEFQTNNGEEIAVLVTLPMSGRISRAMNAAWTRLKPAHPDCEVDFNEKRSQFGLRKVISVEEFVDKFKPFMSLGLTFTNLLVRLDTEEYVPSRQDLELALRIPHSTA